MSKDIFSADNRDKMRKAYASGKKSITVNGIKLVFVKAKRSGWFYAKPASGAKVPMAMIETKANQVKREIKTRELIAQFHKDKATK